MKTGNINPISNLTKLRKMLGLTQAAIANKLGCDIKTFRDYENNKAVPGAAMLKVMYDFFKNEFKENNHTISTDYLLGLSDFISPENDFIGKETGLNNDTIETLKTLDSEQKEILNDLINQGTFKRLLSAMYGYSHSHNDKLIIENEITKKQTPVYNHGNNLLQFSAINTFSTILNNLYTKNSYQGYIEKRNHLINLCDEYIKKANKATDQDTKNIYTRSAWNIKTDIGCLDRDFKKFCKENNIRFQPFPETGKL